MIEPPEFVDTNVLVYAYDRSSPAKRERALALLEHLMVERRLALSLQVLQEFYVVTTRKLQAPLSPEVARQILTDLGKAWVHEPTLGDVLKATHLAERHRISFWDALILQSARALKAQVVWSEDLHPGVYGGLEVRNPFA
ncbi:MULTISPECIES: PIN domain-containing protein [Thermus]|uniref:Ribonuclease VapC n=1 Tax=Thermus antranikianii TaxID=88190 RepID=A0ABY7RQH0_9DEIN|nr:MULTISPECIES: PIN domain-containing protein [Thermus]QWK22211.1 MAG: PIN domain-containing protein [Thermus antranikianii]UZX15453.1 PIN domain-containing protein [Thermus sp. PS18]WCM39131.1 PIN domain-containing protein [Thermus antranikianii]